MIWDSFHIAYLDHGTRYVEGVEDFVLRIRDIRIPRAHLYHEQSNLLSIRSILTASLVLKTGAEES